MTVLVAVPESPEGVAALAAGAAEAQLLNTNLVVVNLSLTKLDTSAIPSGVDVEVLDRHGKADRDPVEAVLDEIRDRSTLRFPWSPSSSARARATDRGQSPTCAGSPSCVAW
jgi:hypothetical protein